MRILREDGFTLPTTMLVLLAMAVIVVGGYALTRVQVHETVYQMRQAQAQEIAQAGLEDALNRISLKPSWKTGYVQKAFAGGYYTVSCSTDVVNRWVTSTGYSAPIAGFGRAARTVQAQSVSTGYYNFADSTFTVNWPITSFDSLVNSRPSCQTSNMNTKGCLAGPAILANVKIVTAAMGGGIFTVNGDVTYAAASSTAPAQSTISGSISVADSTTTIDVEDGTPYINANDNDSSHIQPFKYYNSTSMVLNVTVSSDPVTLSSGTYYFNGINVTSSTLVINMSPGQEAFIYLNGPLYVSPMGMIDSNQTRYACDQHIYGQGGSTITISGYSAVGETSNTTYLDIYAPKDKVVLSQRMLGRLIGKTVDILYPSAYGGGKNYPMLFFDVECGYSQDNGTKWVSGTWTESFFQP